MQFEKSPRDPPDFKCILYAVNNVYGEHVIKHDNEQWMRENFDDGSDKDPSVRVQQLLAEERRTRAKLKESQRTYGSFETMVVFNRLNLPWKMVCVGTKPECTLLEILARAKKERVHRLFFSTTYGASCGHAIGMRMKDDGTWTVYDSFNEEPQALTDVYDDDTGDTTAVRALGLQRKTRYRLSGCMIPTSRATTGWEPTKESVVIDLTGTPPRKKPKYSFIL
jgi:hypothetical protein